jgi:hypothetical protein
MRNKKFTILILLIAAFGLSSCIGVNRGFREIRSNILANVEGDFEREIEFSIGSGLLALAGAFVSFADTEVDVEDMLDQIDRVQIGVFKNRDFREFSYSTRLLDDISQKMKEQGWSYIVKNKERNELAGIFVRENSDNELRQMFVIALERDELVMTEISGHINKLVEIAVRENGIKFERAHM